ncbi:MAG: GNAT family N-acetyltransferase [Longimicrobiales bacterium]
MGWVVRQHEDAAAFLRRAGDWLTGAEAEHNLVLGIAREVAAGRASYQPPLYFATVERSGEIGGYVYRTPPFKLGISRVPVDAMPLIVKDVSRTYGDLPAVLGPAEEARIFAEQWAAAHGAHARPGMHQRIYQLVHVVPPARMPPGEFCVARPEHIDLVTTWLGEFRREAGIVDVRARSLAAERIAEGLYFLWLDDEPVSLAGWSAQSPNGVRVGPVYTPPEKRRRGYASAVTAAASQRALDQGRRFCFLYTDLSNPVSNAIYQQIGYTPVCDVMDWILET